MVAIALAGCGETRTNDAMQAPRGSVEKPVDGLTGDVPYEEPLDDSKETVPDYGSPIETALVFAQSFADGDLETLCAISDCGPGAVAGNFPDYAPTSAELIAQNEIGALVELQMQNPEVGKWCVTLEQDLEGRWRVTYSHTPPPYGSQDCH